MPNVEDRLAMLAAKMKRIGGHDLHLWMSSRGGTFSYTSCSRCKAGISFDHSTLQAVGDVLAMTCDELRDPEGL